MHLEVWQWFYSIVAALLIGVSKTAIPGAGILVVPLLVSAFGGREAVGVMTPLLVCADVFAVVWYHRHTQWDKLIGLYPWVVGGIAVGAVSMWIAGESSSTKDVLGQAIGVMVIAMLGVHLARDKFGSKLEPTSKLGVAGTGALAGFTTMVSNAAGPIMSIYMAAMKMRKNEFMGTMAWYFFTINIGKIPIYILLNKLQPQKPVITLNNLVVDAMLLPGIIIGVYGGKWLLPRISQRAFDSLVLILAAIAAIKLIKG